MGGAAHTRPGRRSGRVGGALHWRRTLRRERRLARERELDLLCQAEARIMSAWLAGENPRHSDDVHHALRRLANAAFESDVLGAWDKRERPHDAGALGGPYPYR